jgi:toxin ParE1/3/4
LPPRHQKNSPSVAAAFEPVRHFPLAAPAREQLGAGLRVTFRDPYAIYYRPFADAIVIIRALHGARDVAAIAVRGGFET